MNDAQMCSELLHHADHCLWWKWCQAHVPDSASQSAGWLRWRPYVTPEHVVACIHILFTLLFSQFVAYQALRLGHLALGGIVVTSGHSAIDTQWSVCKQGSFYNDYICFDTVLNKQLTLSLATRGHWMAIPTCLSYPYCRQYDTLT